MAADLASCVVNSPSIPKPAILSADIMDGNYCAFDPNRKGDDGEYPVVPWYHDDPTGWTTDAPLAENFTMWLERTFEGMRDRAVTCFWLDD